MTISTRNLSRLADIDRLRQTMQSMAMLDAILCPEWQYRYYSFNTVWSPGAQMGSMRNGCGDTLFVHFSPAGCWLKGFAHDSPMSPYRDISGQVWPGVLNTVPAEFADCLREPAFSMTDVTFCVWRRYGDHDWQIGPVEFPLEHPDPDGSEYLLSPLVGNAETYQAWAEDYFEQAVDLSSVEHVYHHEPLTPEVISRFNPDLSLEELGADISEIGYPGAGPLLPGKPD